MAGDEPAGKAEVDTNHIRVTVKEGCPVAFCAVTIRSFHGRERVTSG